MPDLQDGESAEIQGSARLPYILKNVGGVYSCSCPAWRNQSLPIERRTCKHLRQYRGEAAERQRLGALPAVAPANDIVKPAAPALLLAHAWTADVDPTDWLLSEKLDGVRAYWDGQKFLSRQGNVFHAPEWFVENLPNVPLDGELWLARKAFQRTMSIVRRHDQSEHWREISYLVFDAPAVAAPFEERLAYLRETLGKVAAEHVRVHVHYRCCGADHLRNELAHIESLGGEGIMLRQPGSRYEPCRSSTLLKVKTFHDAEARVVAHLPGAGRHVGRLGAVLVELPDGTQFAVGSGFSDAQRGNPPAVGSVITFRYQDLTDRGVPRFPTFVRACGDAELPLVAAGVGNACSTASDTVPATLAVCSFVPTTPSTSTPSISKARQRTARPAQRPLPLLETIPMPRRFEFVGGSSAKFWEVSVSGTGVTVRFGRLGTHGQTQSKSFPNAIAAQKHADKLISQKTGKGYVECVPC